MVVIFVNESDMIDRHFIAFSVWTLTTALFNTIDSTGAAKGRDSPFIDLSSS